MKYLLLLTLFMFGCSKDSPCKNDLASCQMVNSENLRYFHDQCKKLAECMKSDYEVVHLINQKRNPYTCSISKMGKTRQKNKYFYPKGDVMFDELRSDNLENEISVCEMMTETGDSSDRRYEEYDEMFKKIDENKYKKPERRKEPMKIRMEG